MWVPVAVALFGVLGTLAGSISSQIIAGRRDEMRWQKEREHEDRYRNYKDRQTSYADLVSALDAFFNARSNLMRNLADVQTDESLLDDMRNAYDRFVGIANRMQLIAPRDVYPAVAKMHEVLGEYIRYAKSGHINRGELIERFQAINEQWVLLVNSMRSDLGVSPELARLEPGGRHDSTDHRQELGD